MIVCPAPLGGDVLERVDDWVRVGVGDLDRLDALEVPRVVQEQLVGTRSVLAATARSTWIMPAPVVRQ